MSDTYLTLFTIGPVQSFIAKARKLQDLYAGSFLLSHLTIQAINRVKSINETRGIKADVLFPNLDANKKSAPNRILIKVEIGGTEALREFCAGLETFVREEWAKIAKKVFDETRLGYTAAAAAQIESLLQVFYASEPYSGGGQFGERYVNAIKRLGAAKTFRSFTQLAEPHGRKCSLMHEHNALFYREWRGYLVEGDEGAQQVTNDNVRGLDKYIQPDETLGAVSFVKRCLKRAIPIFNDSFPSVTDVYEMHGDKYKEGDDKHGYYAVVMFDGDDMGKWYSEPYMKGVKRESTEQFQKILSSEVSKFAAEKSYKIVNWDSSDSKKSKNGVVVYAGGEDFLGVLNIKDAFSALNELRETFGSIDLREFTEQRLSFSAGVVIAHVKTPLPAVLSQARDAEHKAKARSGKDAFCLSIMKHSGEVTEFVLPFYQQNQPNSNGQPADPADDARTVIVSALATFDRLVEIIVNEKLSVKFIYQLGVELERIAEIDDENLHKEVFIIEAERVLKHSEFEDEEKREKIVKEVTAILKTLTEDSEFKLKNLLMYLRAVAFIAKERGAAQ